MSKRHDYIDVLRGVATLSILHAGIFFHFPDPIERFTKIGTIGVQLFFVLSGLSLSFSYNSSLNSKSNKSNFYLRRILKIIPLFYLAIIVNILVYGLGPKKHAPFGNDLQSILLNLSFLGGFHPDSINSIVDVSWFIFNLFFLYLSFPLLWKCLNNIEKIAFFSLLILIE